MASTTFTVLTPALTGTAITAKTGVASSQTMTIDPSTAQGSLDFASLHIRCANTNSTTGVTLSLADGDQFIGGTIGNASISVATETTIIIGGQGFEGSRFLNSSGTIIFTQTGTGPTSWEAYQSPRAEE